MIKYNEIRPLIKTGDIIGQTHIGYKTWDDKQVQLVMHATKSVFSHVATAWVVGTRVMVIEAVIPQVRIFPLSFLGDFYYFPMIIPFSDLSLDYLLTQVGEEVKYDKWEGVKAFFNKNDPTDKKTQCAEITKTGWEKSGLFLPGRAVPGDLCDNIMDLGVTQIKIKNEQGAH